MPNHDLLPPSLDDLATIAEAALKLLQPALGQYLTGVAMVVEEFADDDTLTALQVETPFDLMGLYHGDTWANDSQEITGSLPPRIHLYRRPILDYWCETSEPLARVVRHVLIHEIGHHFGLSDDDMDRIESETD